MFDRLHDPVSSEPSKTHKETLTKTVLIPLGAPFIAAIGLFGKDAPSWYPWAIAAYAGVVAVSVLAPFASIWYLQVGRYFRERSLAGDYISRFKELVTVLRPALEESRCETVFYVWKSFGQSAEGLKLNSTQHSVFVETNHLRTLSSWLDSIASRLMRAKRYQVRALAAELGHFVSQYSRFCAEAHRQLDGACTHGGLEPHALRRLKQEWNQARDRHNLTIKCWEDMAKNLNAGLGDKVCFDNFESLKTME